MCNTVYLSVFLLFASLFEDFEKQKKKIHECGGSAHYQSAFPVCKWLVKSPEAPTEEETETLSQWTALDCLHRTQCINLFGEERKNEACFAWLHTEMFWGVK